MKKNLFKLVAVLLVCGVILSVAVIGTDLSYETVGEKTPPIQAADSVVIGDGETKVPSVNVVGNNATPGGIPADLLGTSPNVVQPSARPEDVSPTAPKGDYNKGTVLVKAKDSFDVALLGELQYASAEALYDGAKWYMVKLADENKTEDAVAYLSELDTFEKVDYDYVMGVTVKETDNPNYDQQTNLGLSNIPHGWTVNGKAPGGSPDVVVAVIDTGVDYNHLDLRNNIWVNAAEIPDNGKDDDGNGYIDDIYGWDCVGNDKDPIDDNGHGTHVAGIIAAENNKLGGIGVAYNCKVMVLKAGNSSGYFNNSDIAEAIQYAYMNGASVINMSFGGSGISIAVEDALENAYTDCVLVAAAGNDGACNNLACKECVYKAVTYPAALPYVIGVMSTDKDGKHVSSFSNYDHNPYDAIEYEVYAVGEGVGSTWPSNKYACLNGTSMATPTVSGIAALLRSYYTDREVYSTKFIQSQIVNTGSVHPHILDHETDEAHSVADVQEAMNKLPKPAVNLYGYTVDDSTSISKNNNGNGVVDAGETIRLYISLHNRGGVATNVNVSIDTYRREIGDESLADPYFTFVNNTIALSDIGTYSVRESGDKYFEIVVSADCPNDYLVDFNIRFTYKNGIDGKDNVVYENCGVAHFIVSRGWYLPLAVAEDTIYEADRLYIVVDEVRIPDGVTVIFEEGCQIEFKGNGKIRVYGNLYLNGTKEDMVILLGQGSIINGNTSAEINFNYVDAGRISLSGLNIVNNSFLRDVSAKQVLNSHVGYVAGVSAQIIDGCFIKKESSVSYRGDSGIFTNNVVVVAGFNLGSDSYDGSKFEFVNNVFVNGLDISGRKWWVDNRRPDGSYYDSYGNDPCFRFNVGTDLSTNTFPKEVMNNPYYVVKEYYNQHATPQFDLSGSCSDIKFLWPYVVSVEMFDANGDPITTVGKEDIKIRVTFNRPMDKNSRTFLTFGTVEPYADYRIDGEYISDTVWEGTYTLKAQIENGQNFLKVNNAWAAEDQTKTVFGEDFLHEFTIDTSAALSMNLLAMPRDNGIELTFAQDDYDTLLGYNVYRSTEKDGNYVKLNPAILLPDENVFLDENAEPGKTYWYTYTVVLSDFTESAPAGKVQATAKDTMSPSLYHTPVNQGYENNNLVISCTASDNVGISKVTLYYRTVGAAEWKSLVMFKQNDKYSATVFGSDVTLAGLEYYIVAEDTLNSVQKGSAETPYTVVVKAADSLLGLGDVDGNGAVTTKDALMIMQALSGDLILTDDQFKRANLNGDAILSSAEALRILRYVNGNESTLEM